MKIAGIEITHPDKLIFPKAKISKLEMIQYYEKLADKMLPYLHNRPLTLHRFPDGIQSKGFYQKNTADYFPSFIKTVRVKTKEGSNTQPLCNSKKSLIYLANQGTIGFHIWLSQKDKLNKPNKVVFDLDPSKNSFKKVKEAANLVGEFLKDKGKDPQIMTTGKRGFHIWFSLRRTKKFDDIRDEVKGMAREMEEEHPEILTTAVRKNKRENKIFIDYLRNSYAQTSVCPYSLRPTEQAGVAFPISWNALYDIKDASYYNLKKVGAR